MPTKKSYFKQRALTREEILLRPMGWCDIGFYLGTLLVIGIYLYREIVGIPLERPDAHALLAFLAMGTSLYVVLSIQRRRLLRYFREAIEITPSAFALYDNEGFLVARNGAYEEVHKEAFSKLQDPIRYEDLIRASLKTGMSEAEAEVELQNRLESHNEASGEANDRLYHNGRWLRVLKARTESGANVGVGIDVTELYNAKAQADREHARFRGVAESLPVGIWHYDADGRTIFVNPQLLSLFGLSNIEDLDDVVAPDFIAAHVDGLESTETDANHDHLGNLTIRSSDSTTRHVIVHSTELPADTSGTTESSETIISFVDVSALKEAERRIEYLAHSDLLTGTRNRAAFMVAIEAAAQTASPTNPCWVVAMDLDGFKLVNDRYGHAAGDRLLRAFTNRIQSVKPANSVLYRLGGDEFCLLVSNLTRQQMEDCATRMLTAVADPFPINDGNSRVNMSVGIAAMPTDTNDPEAAQRYADLALYASKDNGGGAYVFFNREHAERDLEERIMTLDLARAVADGEFTFEYQPLFTRAERQVLSVEALLRWTNQRSGQTISPSEFIPTAERVGAIASIDMWVFNHVAEQFSEWHARGVAVPLIMVNMSPITMEDSDFLPRIDRILEKRPEIRDHICIEITEGVIIKDRDRLVQTFNELKDRGIQTAIDDFGTGQTSVALLRDLPVSFIKIDRGYINGIETDPQSLAIVSMVTQLGRQLGVTVVGEGVETLAQLRALDSAGCEVIQGFLWGRPCPAAEIEALISENSASEDYAEFHRLPGLRSA